MRLVSMSTETDFSPGSAQLAFIGAELASVDRTKTPWVRWCLFVFMFWVVIVIIQKTVVGGLV